MKKGRQDRIAETLTVIQDNTIPRLSFADGCGICFAVCYKKGSGTKSRR